VVLRKKSWFSGKRVGSPGSERPEGLVLRGKELVLRGKGPEELVLREKSWFPGKKELVLRET